MNSLPDEAKEAITLEDIMPNGEWDWFGLEPPFKTFEVVKANYHIAMLLTNKSWCKAVWGEKYGYFSAIAFRILQQENEQACINYINKTKLNAQT